VEFGIGRDGMLWPYAAEAMATRILVVSVVPAAADAIPAELDAPMMEPLPLHPGGGGGGGG